MIRFLRLDHIQICIPTGSENQARKFYTEVLGLTEIPKPQELLHNGGIWYQIADIQLHIGVEEERNISKRHPAFEVTDLDEALKLLKADGVPIKIDTQIPGQRRFSFFDPFGNRIELLKKIS